MSYYVTSQKHSLDQHPTVPPTEYYEVEDLVANNGVPKTGCLITLKVVDPEDLRREIFRSEMATVKIPMIALEQPAGSSRYTTLGDMLMELRDGVVTALNMMNNHENTILQVSRAMHSFATADCAFSFVVDDPLGISFITQRPDFKAMDEGDDDVNLTVYRYRRDWFQDTEIGVAPPLLEAQKKSVESLKELMRDANKVVLFSGAGISTESGIPAFRNTGVELVAIANDDGITHRWPKGQKLNPNAHSVMYYDVTSASDRRLISPIWKQFNMSDMEIDKILSNKEIRATTWDRHIMLRRMALQAKPNPAHEIAAWLAKQNKLKAVITQNIDGLLQRTGVPNDLIIELHGSLINPLVCVQAKDATPPAFGSGCGAHVDWKVAMDARNRGDDPTCPECGGLLFADVIAFGQPLDPDVVAQASEVAKECDLMIVMGTGLLVAPANRIAATPLSHSIPLVIINKESTPLDNYATVLLNNKCGEVMAEIMELGTSPPETL